MDRRYADQACSETLASSSLVRGRYASARDSEEGVWRILAVRCQISHRRAFQVSGKDRRGDFDASVHHNHRSFFILLRSGHFIIAEGTSSATRFDDVRELRGRGREVL